MVYERQPATDTLDASWLIQRLRPPYKGDKIELDAIEFGCALRNQEGLNSAINLMRGLFNWDYMGSAEFEFGAIPRCLKNIANSISEYTFGTIMIKSGSATTPVYAMCKKGTEKAVALRICWLAEEHRYLKESVMLSEAVGVTPTWDGKKSDYIGWLELDNEFMFFTDQHAMRGIAKMFGLKENENEIIQADTVVL